MDDVQLTEVLIERAHVAVTPGSAIGPAGEGRIRLSYATSEDRLKTGLHRMREALEQ